MHRDTFKVKEKRREREKERERTEKSSRDRNGLESGCFDKTNYCSGPRVVGGLLVQNHRHRDR